METHPLVSVIIPIYNGEGFVEETIQSILTQTHENFELLLMNDGSTDGSLNLIEQFNDPRIRIVTHQNMGLIGTLNKAIRLAKADIVARLDQDDISKPHRLEHQLRAMKNFDLDVCYSQLEKFGLKNTWDNRERQTERPGEVIMMSPLDYGCLVHSTMMAKRSVLLDTSYRKEYYPCDDWDLQLRLEAKYRVGFLQEKLLRYRFHEGANTYPTFFMMQEKRRWCESNAIRRGNGEDEESLDEYQKRQTSLYKKWNRRRKDLYFYHFRMSGDSYLQGRYFAMVKHMCFAIPLAPEKIWQRISGKMR